MKHPLIAALTILLAVALTGVSVGQAAPVTASFLQAGGTVVGETLTEDELLDRLTEEQAARYRELRGAAEQALQEERFEDAQALTEQMLDLIRDAFGIPEPPEGFCPEPCPEGEAEAQALELETTIVEFFESLEDLTEEQLAHVLALQEALAAAAEAGDCEEVVRIMEELAAFAREVRQQQLAPAGPED